MEKPVRNTGIPLLRIRQKPSVFVVRLLRKRCGRYFNYLTNTVFNKHKFPIYYPMNIPNRLLIDSICIQNFLILLLSHNCIIITIMICLNI